MLVPLHMPMARLPLLIEAPACLAAHLMGLAVLVLLVTGCECRFRQLTVIVRYGAFVLFGPATGRKPFRNFDRLPFERGVPQALIARVQNGAGVSFMEEGGWEALLLLEPPPSHPPAPPATEEAMASSDMLSGLDEGGFLVRGAADIRGQGYCF